MRRFPPLSAALVLVTMFAAVSAQAEEIVMRSAMDLVAWDQHIARTDQLEAELVALRQRVDHGGPANTWVEQPGCDLICPGWNASVEYLNWRLRRRGLDFAITTDTTALAVGAGDVQNLSFGRDAGIRSGFSYTTKTGWELGFGYTHFDTHANAQAAEPVGGNLWATRSHPNQNEEAATASLMGDLDYDIFDLELRRWFVINRFAAIQWLGGLRWADINQDLRYDYDGRDFANGVIINQVDTRSFGVRLGAEGHWQLPRGFSLFARGAGTLSYGKFQTRLLETNNAGVDTIVDVSDDYQQAVPAIEAAIGASWRNERFEISTGYELTNWFNLADRSMFVDSIHEGAYSPKSMDLLLEGYYVRGAIMF